MREIFYYYLRKYDLGRKILLFGGVIFPGFSKFIYALIIKKQDGLGSLGVYSNDLAIIVVLSAISSLGFSAVLMNRVPGKIPAECNAIFTRVCFMAAITVLAFIPILFCLEFFGLLFNAVSSGIFLFGLTGYQLYRQFLFSLGDYGIVFFLELSFIIIVPILFVFIPYSNYLLIQGSFYVLFFCFVFLKNYSTKVQLNWEEFKSGFRFGLANLSSNILGSVSIPLANQMLGITYAGFIGFVQPILSFIMVFPRSLSTYYVPAMVRVKEVPKELSVLYSRYVGLNNFILLSFAVLIIGSWFLVKHFIPFSEIYVEYSSSIFIILIINMFFSQLGLPLFSILKVFDFSGISLIANFSTLLVFLIGIPFLVSIDGISGFVLVYILLSVLYVTRFFVIRSVVKVKIRF